MGVAGGHVGDDEQERSTRRRVAGAAGVTGAAGAALTGAQALLGMDVAEAAIEGEDATASAIPLGDAPAPAADVDVEGDVAALLDDDVDLGTAEPIDPLDDGMLEVAAPSTDLFTDDAEDVDDLDADLDDLDDLDADDDLADLGGL